MNKIHNHRASFRTKFHTGCFYWSTLGEERRTAGILRHVYKDSRTHGYDLQESRDIVINWVVKNPIVLLRKPVEL